MRRRLAAIKDHFESALLAYKHALDRVADTAESCQDTADDAVIGGNSTDAGQAKQIEAAQKVFDTLLSADAGRAKAWRGVIEQLNNQVASIGKAIAAATP